MMVDSTVKVFKFVWNVMLKYVDYTYTFGVKDKGIADRHLVNAINVEIPLIIYIYLSITITKLTIFCSNLSGFVKLAPSNDIK